MEEFATALPEISRISTIFWVSEEFVTGFERDHQLFKVWMSAAEEKRRTTHVDIIV